MVPDREEIKRQIESLTSKPSDVQVETESQHVRRVMAEDLAGHLTADYADLRIEGMGGLGLC